MPDISTLRVIRLKGMAGKQYHRARDVIRDMRNGSWFLSTMPDAVPRTFDEICSAVSPPFLIRINALTIYVESRESVQNVKNLLDTRAETV